MEEQTFNSRTSLSYSNATSALLF